jgi:hypothetical protein
MQNRVNDSLTPALLRELAAAKPPCITVAVQTGGNARARLENAIRQIEREVTARDPAIPKSVFAPFHDSLAAIAELRPTGSLVILSSPDFHRKFETEAPVQEVVLVEDEFHLRSLLPLLNRKTEFYILALSQNHPRILHCTESESGEVAFTPDVPKDYLQSRETRQPDHTLDNRSSAGPSVGSMKGVLSGSSSDADNKDEYHLNYYKMIERGVKHLLGETGIPLVVVAVEHELALYRSVNTYPATVEPGVHGAPDGLKGGEMHKRALELIQSQPTAPVKKELEHFEKFAGTGHASSHAQEIVKAAYEGRISHLFLQESAEYRGNFDEMRQKVKRHDDGVAPMRDLLNEAVVQTLRHGGDALVLPAKDMPNGAPICAIFRYPSTELQAAMRESASGAAQSA